MPALHWLYLAVAIAAEVTATTALKASEGFTRLLPSALVVAGYAVSFYLLSLTLRTLPVAIVYAVWSGAGIVLVTLIGWFALRQPLGPVALAGIGLIVVGVVVLNLAGRH